MQKAKKYKVVMTDYDFTDLEYIERELVKVDAELVSAQCKTEAEVIELSKDADGIIAEYFKPVSRKIMESSKKCKVICRTGVGVDTIDIQAATDCGICVVNVLSYCEEEVSDEAMALLLTCARKTVILNNSVKGGEWDFKIAKPIYRLTGKTLGMVGYGKIPRKLTPKAKGFGLTLLCYDPYIDKAIPIENGVEPVSFKELLSESDFVSIHPPLTDETRGMFGEDEFRMMKKTAYIINTARGPIVQNKALYKALTNGWIVGAGLDVMEIEQPEKDNPLLKLDNVIITPHSAWYSEDSIVSLLTQVGQEVARVLTGNSPRSLVNPEVRQKVRLV